LSASHQHWLKAKSVSALMKFQVIVCNPTWSFLLNKRYLRSRVVRPNDDATPHAIVVRWHRRCFRSVEKLIATWKTSASLRRNFIQMLIKKKPPGADFVFTPCLLLDYFFINTRKNQWHCNALSRCCLPTTRPRCNQDIYAFAEKVRVHVWSSDIVVCGMSGR